MTSGFLRHMVAATRADIARGDYLTEIPERKYGTRPSLRAALVRGTLIAEYKRRSPGASTPGLPQGSVETFLRGAAEAEAYSVLASRPEFGGAPADVAAVAAATARPVLFKDFVVSPVQIEAARRAGASAVLLIARLEDAGLLDQPLSSLAQVAHDRGLEVLLEWHRRAELRRTEDVPADVFGINVRDLDTLEIRRDVAAETFAAARDRHPLVGMSGVLGPEQAQTFWEDGADALLIGSELARTKDPATFLRGLRPVAGRSGA